jgi:phytoene dehydrogenase-like protein
MRNYTVVGGGLAGLTAANALADAGNGVTLLEQSRHLGGRARTRREDGYFLNLGPHALYRGGIAARTMDQWGIRYSGAIPGRPIPGHRTCIVRGQDFYPSITDLGSLLKTRMFGVGEKVELAKLLRLLTAGRSREKDSMAEWVDRHLQTERVRQFAEMAIRISTYAVDLEALSAAAALAQIGLALKHNVLYLDGGWQTLVDGLAERAKTKGVVIGCAKPVEKLGEIRADGVVLAVGSQAVERLTGVRVPGKRRAARLATLDLCLDRVPDTVVAFAVDRPIYWSTHSAYARLAPNGGGWCTWRSIWATSAATQIRIARNWRTMPR